MPLHGHIPTFILSKYLGMGWLEHMIGVCLTFRKCPIVPQRVCASLHSHQQCLKVPSPPYLCQHLMCLFSFIHFSKFVMVSHCDFNLHFSNDRYCVVHVYNLFIFFGEMYIQIFGPYFYWVASYLIIESFLYNLDRSSLSGMWFVNISSKSMTCLFIS